MSSCDDDVAGPVDPPALTTEEQIIADCYVLRDALEAFAAENDGEYPMWFTQTSDAGNQFITFLPGGMRFTNRYTGLVTTPAFGDPQWPGEITALRPRAAKWATFLWSTTESWWAT